MPRVLQLFLLAAASLLPAFSWGQVVQGSYNISPTAVTGSARNVALGGAMLASPDGYSTVFTNPAGLGGLSGKGIDFGSDSNNIENEVLDLDNPKARSLNDPIDYSYYGARFASDDGWGVGFSVGTPFSLDNQFSGTSRVTLGKTVTSGTDQIELKVDDKAYTVAVGKAFYDKRLDLGLAVNYIQISETYNFIPAPTLLVPAVSEVATNDTFALDLGAIGQPWPWLQIGALYKMGFRVAFDQTRNVGLPTTTNGNPTPFRDCKVPDKFSLGLVWKPHKMFNLFASASYTMAMRDGLVVASGLFPGGNNVLQMGRFATADGHWGLEFKPIDEPDLTFKLWAGGYLEETGVEGGYNRYHNTAGFNLAPWFLSLSFADDDSSYYNNFVVGLGVDILQVAARIAKANNWKLPIE
jgi:hypothetical protein